MTGASTDDRRQRQIGPAHIPVAKNPANRKPTFAPVAKGEHENSTTYPMSSFLSSATDMPTFPLCEKSRKRVYFSKRNVMDCKEHMCGGERCVFLATKPGLSALSCPIHDESNISQLLVANPDDAAHIVRNGSDMAENVIVRDLSKCQRRHVSGVNSLSFTEGRTDRQTFRVLSRNASVPGLLLSVSNHDDLVKVTGGIKKVISHIFGNLHVNESHRWTIGAIIHDDDVDVFLDDARVIGTSSHHADDLSSCMGLVWNKKHHRVSAGVRKLNVLYRSWKGKPLLRVLMLRTTVNQHEKLVACGDIGAVSPERVRTTFFSVDPSTCAGGLRNQSAQNLNAVVAASLMHVWRLKHALPPNRNGPSCEHCSSGHMTAFDECVPIISRCWKCVSGCIRRFVDALELHHT